MTKKIVLQTVLIALVAAIGYAGQPRFDTTQLEPGHAVAVFAGGCFWCMEPPYDNLPGVVETIAGYTGGTTTDPTYRQVTRGDTGHYEALLVVYRPEEVSYEELLEVFWVNIDPTDAGGQFCDRGSSYRSAIFVARVAEREAAERAKREIEARGTLPGGVITPILDAQPFYVAEEYHQDYYRKNPFRYQLYRNGCGRDARLRALWGT